MEFANLIFILTNIALVASVREPSIRSFAIRTLTATAVESAQYYPKGRQLLEKRLRSKLGDNFNAAWMSVDKPFDDEPHTTTKYTIDARLLQYLGQVNFSTTDVTMKPYMQKALEKWLLEKASCPVRFSWKDIGGLFWPRWIKLGECVTGSPCSWPPGMHCVPAESHTIHVLRWHCRKRKRNRKQLLSTPFKEKSRKNEEKKNRRRKNRRSRDYNNGVTCKWLTVPYPVTSECFCSC